MYWLILTLKSLKNRRTTALLTLFMIAVSSCLLFSVDRVRLDTRNSFTNTLSGADLLVGARTGSLNLLLYSVFRIGNATNNIAWSSYQKIAADDAIAWTIPISLGDSHKGFRVVGTDSSYMEHYQYGNRQHLKMAEGKWFSDVYDVVLGAEVAQRLNYHLGQKVVLSHGTGAHSFTQHADKPFVVSGILAPTGTPVDRSLHIPLEGMTAIHVDWVSGAQLPGVHISADQTRHMNLTPKDITAFLVGMKSRLQAFRIQRAINEFEAEPLMAIIPGSALQELWQMLGVAEKSLIAISVMVVITSLIGTLTVILTGLYARRREMAIFRAVGAGSRQIITMLVFESGLFATLGLACGLLLHLGLTAIISPLIQERYGIQLSLSLPSAELLLATGGFILAAMAAGLIPGIQAYRNTLQDGLTQTH